MNHFLQGVIAQNSDGRVEYLRAAEGGGFRHLWQLTDGSHEGSPVKLVLRLKITSWVGRRDRKWPRMSTSRPAVADRRYDTGVGQG